MNAGGRAQREPPDRIEKSQQHHEHQLGQVPGKDPARFVIDIASAGIRWQHRGAALDEFDDRAHTADHQ